ncbi:hypothetical protein TEA_008083 [Camellia sinensis var. sinensis]|uniref:Phospholipase/carboxylesterase/thioesterase domain-containing protein n=1 Tax=Camellia sinensis var. sinensis TaxID=542762 RepID=A0A4S4D7C6_CAMSN|nr:hypothetical protein TEA_008083 [Camellia sinensis var. sinensis]
MCRGRESKVKSPCAFGFALPLNTLPSRQFQLVFNWFTLSVADADSWVIFHFDTPNKMSFGSTSGGSGSRTSQRTFEFGRTHVVRPKGKHQATIVWLHGLGDKGSRCYASIGGPLVHYPGNAFNLSIKTSLSWSQLLETLPLPNIKWICPTAPTRPVAVFGGFPCTAWFDVGDISEDSPDDLEGLDASAVHVANLLSTEPPDSRPTNLLACHVYFAIMKYKAMLPALFLNSYCMDLFDALILCYMDSDMSIGLKLGVGGFSMGAATALYSATCHVFRQYGNGSPYPVHLSAIVGLSGWLPCSRTLKNRLEGSNDAARRAASLPVLLCHGLGDEVVAYNHGENSAQTLSSAGFRNLTFRSYNGLGHYTTPEETDEVCNWLTAWLGLDGSRS